MVKRGGIKRQGTPFSRNLAAWMALAGMDDVDLAQKVGVSAMTVGRWRSGENTPTTEKWPAIAEALNVEDGVAKIGQLLINVALLPPDVQTIAEKLAAMPLRQRQKALERVDDLLRELDSKQDNVSYGMTCAQGAGA